MDDNEPREVRIFVGEWVSTKEFADRLEQLQREQDESTDEPGDD